MTLNESRFRPEIFSWTKGLTRSNCLLRPVEGAKSQLYTSLQHTERVSVDGLPLSSLTSKYESLGVSPKLCLVENGKTRILSCSKVRCPTRTRTKGTVCSPPSSPSVEASKFGRY